MMTISKTSYILLLNPGVKNSRTLKETIIWNILHLDNVRAASNQIACLLFVGMSKGGPSFFNPLFPGSSLSTLCHGQKSLCGR